MAHFNFRGRNNLGELVSGKLEAQNLEDAASKLTRQAIVPLNIAQERSYASSFVEGFNKLLTAKTISIKEQFNFFSQLAMLINAGVSISKALEQLAKVSANTSLAKVAKDLATEVASGNSLQQAFSHQKVFSQLAVRMVAVGESTGNLSECLTYLSECLESDYLNHQKLGDALRYPALVVAVAIAALFAMNILVIPKFKEMFSHYAVALPLATRIFIRISDFTVDHPLFLVLMALSFMGLWRFLHYRETNMYVFDKFKWKLPMISQVVQYLSVAQFSQVLNLALKSGILLVDALKLCASSVSNRYFSVKLNNMALEIEKGESFSSCLTRTKLLPPLAAQMLLSADEAQQLAKVSALLGPMYERQASRKLNNLLQLLEPLLLATIGLTVLGMALAIYLPMWNMVNVR